MIVGVPDLARTVLAPRLAGTRVHKIIQEALPGPESDQIVVLVDRGEVGDPAMLRPRRPIECCVQRLMVCWHQWRALPSGRHVGSPEIVRHRDPEPPCQPRSVANLDRQP